MNSQVFARLGEIVSAPLKRGTQRRDDRDGQQVPFVDTRKVTEGPAKLVTPPREQIVAWSGAPRTREGDLLLVSRGLTADRKVGCVLVAFAESAEFSASLTRVRVDRSRAVPDYVRLYLTSQQGRAALIAASTGTVVSNLRPSSLAEIEIRLPSLSDQEAIVEAMAGLEEQMARVESIRETLQSAHETLREALINGVLEIPGRRKAPSG